MFKNSFFILTGFVFSIWTCHPQFTPKPYPNLEGIAKILDDTSVLAKSFKEGNVFTMEYLNQIQPQLRGYASFSFKEKGNAAQRIYKLLSKGFQQENPKPVIRFISKSLLIDGLEAFSFFMIASCSLTLLLLPPSTGTG